MFNASKLEERQTGNEFTSFPSQGVLSAQSAGDSTGGTFGVVNCSILPQRFYNTDGTVG